MKNTIILTALFLFVTGSAFASGDLTMVFTSTGLSVYGAKVATATNTSILIGKTSTGVGVGMMSTAAGYSLVTQHKSGSKAFGGSFNSTSLYQILADAIGTVKLDKPTDVTSTSFLGTGWSSM